MTPNNLEAILATPDIAVEQKMEARLQRAEWRIASDTPEAAMPDLAAVVASARNFDGIEERALALLESLEGSGAPRRSDAASKTSRPAMLLLICC